MRCLFAFALNMKFRKNWPKAYFSYAWTLLDNNLKFIKIWQKA